MRVLELLRVIVKLVLRHFGLRARSFCKECGRDVHDFVVPDSVWERADPFILRGHTLCYDCFCEACGRRGLPTVWHLAQGCTATVRELRDENARLLAIEARLQNEGQRHEFLSGYMCTHEIPASKWVLAHQITAADRAALRREEGPSG